MGGRLQFLVLVVALVTSAAAQPSVQSNVMGLLLLDRCRDSVGEKAVTDIENVVPQSLDCVKIDEMTAEFTRTVVTNGMKEALGNVCRRRVQLLSCFDPVFEAVKRCLDEEEQELFTKQRETMKHLADFLCEHDDEIVAIYVSQEENQCFTSLAGRVEQCNPYLSKSRQELEKSLKSLEQYCKDTGGFLECVTTSTGNCQDSAVSRLINDMKREVIDDGVCSKKAQTGGAAAILSRIGIFPEPMGRFILAVIVPYLLRL